MTESDPTCTSVAAIERRHIEAYKLALAAHPGKRGNSTVSATTIRHNLGMARTFFERIIDWDWPDAPRAGADPGRRPAQGRRANSEVPR